MQERLYTQAPVIAIFYPNDLEGYRKDRITSITPIPEDKGLLYGGSGYWPFYTVDVKATAAGGGAAGGGSNTGLIAGIVGGVVAVGLVAFLATRRRKGAADERE
jgi:peptide/nickel transport system substrate-binding protein